jgi:hypothetical protein
MLVQLLEAFVKKHNFQYDTAINGLLALRAFQNSQQHYDIVLMGKKNRASEHRNMLTWKQTLRCRL